MCNNLFDSLSAKLAVKISSSEEFYNLEEENESYFVIRDKIRKTLYDGLELPFGKVKKGLEDTYTLLVRKDKNNTSRSEAMRKIKKAFYDEFDSTIQEKHAETLIDIVVEIMARNHNSADYDFDDQSTLPHHHENWMEHCISIFNTYVLLGVRTVYSMELHSTTEEETDPLPECVEIADDLYSEVQQKSFGDSEFRGNYLMFLESSIFGDGIDAEVRGILPELLVSFCADIAATEFYYEFMVPMHVKKFPIDGTEKKKKMANFCTVQHKVMELFLNEMWERRHPPLPA